MWFQNRRVRAKRAVRRQTGHELHGSSCSRRYMTNTTNSNTTEKQGVNREKPDKSLKKHSLHVPLPPARPIPLCISYYPSLSDQLIAETVRSPQDIGISSTVTQWHSKPASLSATGNSHTINFRPGLAQSTFMSEQRDYLSDHRSCGAWTNPRAPFPEVLNKHHLQPSFQDGCFGTGTVPADFPTCAPYQYNHGYRHPYDDPCCHNVVGPVGNIPASLTETDECKMQEEQRSLNPALWCCSAAAITGYMTDM